MKLSELFKNYSGIDIEVTGLSINTKTIKPGDLFICIKGAKVDRHDYLDEAINNGAVALVTSKDVDVEIPYVKVDNPNDELFSIYSKFYDNPLSKLTIIGITGTDGKTSTTSIIQTLLGSDICGYIGTNGYSCSKFKRETDNTTPPINELIRIFKEFVDAGCKYVAMEASSEAFYYGRLKDITFGIGGITNIDSEHLNTHKTLENYIECKKMLFKQSKLAILNSHDKHFSDVVNVNSNNQTYGFNQNDNLYIKSYDVYPNKTKINYVYMNTDIPIDSPLLGEFNVENLALALLTCLNLGFDLNHLLNNIDKLYVDGRMTSVDLGQNFYVLVDYAHTPNGLRKLFSFTNKLNVNKKIVVTGNAGERDASKRKFVGELCVLNNDHVIFCYEDPRFEDPLNVINDLTELVKDKDNYETIVDRHAAIETAILNAEENDLIMILGKGNENYEEIKGQSVPFNDIDEAIKALKKKLNQG